MNAIIPFAYDGGELRVVMQDAAPWFVLADLCRVLEIANARDAATRLDDDEKGVGQTDTPGGVQNVTIVSEAGLYRLVLRSDKPQAKPFQKWVTSEVLPSIRGTGAYAAPTAAVPALPAPSSIRPDVKASRRYGSQSSYRPVLFTLQEAADQLDTTMDQLEGELSDRGWIYEINVYPFVLAGEQVIRDGWMDYAISTERRTRGRDRLIVQIRITSLGMSVLLSPLYAPS